MNLELGDVGCFFDVQTTYSIADICHEGIEADTMLLAKAFHELPCKVSFLTRRTICTTSRKLQLKDW